MLSLEEQQMASTGTSKKGNRQNNKVAPKEPHTPPPTAPPGSMFVELLREKDDSVTMYFRAKAQQGDGVGFYCIARHDYAGPGSLFESLVGDPQRLKCLAVQSDVFFHTGHFSCGFCTVKDSIGKARIRNIVPNTPYKVAICVSLEDDGASAAHQVAAVADIVTSSDDEDEAARNLAIAGGGDPHIERMRQLAKKEAKREKMLKHQQEMAEKHQQSQGKKPTNKANKSRAAMHSVSLPFTEEVQLRELKEKPQKIVAVYHLAGHSPWLGVLLPSLNCVQVIAHKYYNFLRRITHNPMADIAKPLSIRGVTDPLCGIYVALTQTCGDIARKFGGVRNEVPSGVLLEALAALGSATATPSLKGPWIVDWLDFLILCTCETRMFSRLQQLILQYKTYDLEGQTIRARVTYMIRPETTKIPPGSLVDMMNELVVNPPSLSGHHGGKKKKNNKLGGSFSSGGGALAASSQPAQPTLPFTPARAIWSFMPHRQQVRALRYMYPSQTTEAAIGEARIRALTASDPEKVLKLVRQFHIGSRFDSWLMFVEWKQRVRQIQAEKRAKTKETLQIVAASQKQSEFLVMKIRFADWKYYRRWKKVERVIQPENEKLLMRRAWSTWTVFIKPAYRFPLLPVDMLSFPRSSIMFFPGDHLRPCELSVAYRVHPCYIGAKVVTRLGKKSYTVDVTSACALPQSVARGPKNGGTILPGSGQQSLAGSFAMSTNRRPISSAQLGRSWQTPSGEGGSPHTAAGSGVRFASAKKNKTGRYVGRHLLPTLTPAAAKGANTITTTDPSNPLNSIHKEATPIQEVPTHVGLSPQQVVSFELLRATNFRMQFAAYRLWIGYNETVKKTRKAHDEKAVILSVLISAMKGNQRAYAFTLWKGFAAERRREEHARSVRLTGSGIGFPFADALEEEEYTQKDPNEQSDPPPHSRRRRSVHSNEAKHHNDGVGHQSGRRSNSPDEHQQHHHHRQRKSTSHGEPQEDSTNPHKTGSSRRLSASQR